MKKIRKIISDKKFWAAMMVVFLGVGGFFMAKGKVSEKKEEKAKTAIVKRKDVEKKISLSGWIDAHEKATLKFQTSGLLAWVGVKEGDWVKKGQAIASLDKRQLKKNFEKEMNDYLEYRWDWEQGREDYDYENRWFEVSDSVKRILEKNQFDLNKAVLDVELADLTVRLATITTPIEGIVTKIESPYAGVNITPATAEFEIVNPKTVYFYAEADEEEVVDLKNDQTAQIFLDAYPEQVFSGEISQVSFVPVKETGSPGYSAKIDFLGVDNADAFLRMRMEGEAEILVAVSENALFVPYEFVNGDEKKWVYVLNKAGEKEKRFVEIGLQTDEEIEIVSGLSDGEKIVAS